MIPAVTHQICGSRAMPPALMKLREQLLTLYPDLDNRLYNDDEC
jgi:hypothetical protein